MVVKISCKLSFEISLFVVVLFYEYLYFDNVMTCEVCGNCIASFKKDAPVDLLAGPLPEFTETLVKTFIYKLFD